MCIIMFRLFEEDKYIVLDRLIVIITSASSDHRPRYFYTILHLDH